ncbi:MAG: molybdopterin molybdotransferase MoeA, partial [Candidatus Zixiibacteriota bacterium]
CGHNLSEDIVSGIDVVPFRNSAMDGFAVSSRWLAGCASSSPLSLPYTPALFAGQDASSINNYGQPLKIMTGAQVPDQFDAVIKVEDVAFDEDKVTFTSETKPGANVRERGEDIARGSLLYEKGRMIGPLDIGILASVGLRTVSVVRKPSALIVITGDELVEPGLQLKAGEIYNSNRRTIRALIGGFCGEIKIAGAADAPGAAGAIGDDPGSLASALSAGSIGSEVVVSTGGVSAGDRDYLIGAAESAGWTSVFHKVAIKPGKPFYFARRDSQLLFGLPGNPLSAAVTCAVFVIPALKKLMGRPEFLPAPSPARLESPRRPVGDRTLIWPGKITALDSYTRASLSGKTSSASLSALLDSDGLIIQHSSQNGENVETLSWNQILS